LVVLLERSLLQELHWLQHLATEENERPPTETSTMTGASSSSRSFRLQLVDCLIDVPSDALSRQWPCSSPNGLAVPTPPPKERTLDTEQWRLVLSLARVDLRIRSQAQKTAQRSLLLRCGRIQGYLSDHPANLSQLELWSESTGEFLSSMGFAPILEISSASCSAGKASQPAYLGQLGGASAVPVEGRLLEGHTSPRPVEGQLLDSRPSARPDASPTVRSGAPWRDIRGRDVVLLTALEGTVPSEKVLGASARKRGPKNQQLEPVQPLRARRVANSEPFELVDELYRSPEPTLRVTEV
ncbi:Hypothetical protein SCF082_LOCUS12942, partial [Durusdinium trenchii]